MKTIRNRREFLHLLRDKICDSKPSRLMSVVLFDGFRELFDQYEHGDGLGFGWTKRQWGAHLKKDIKRAKKDPKLVRSSARVVEFIDQVYAEAYFETGFVSFLDIVGAALDTLRIEPDGLLVGTQGGRIRLYSTADFERRCGVAVDFELKLTDHLNLQ